MLNKTHNQSNTLSQRRTGKVRRLYFSAVLMLALCAALACPALAAEHAEDALGALAGVVGLDRHTQLDDTPA